MKSGRNFGNVKMRGKRERRLYCGCCTARDKRGDYAKELARREISELPAVAAEGGAFIVPPTPGSANVSSLNFGGLASADPPLSATGKP